MIEELKVQEQRVRWRRAISTLALFFIVSILLTGIAYYISHRGVNVTLCNASGKEITNINIRFSGGNRSHSGLKPEECFSTRVNPTGESGLTIEYNDTEGETLSQFVNFYIEHNYGGELIVTIPTNGVLTWRGRTRF